MDARNKKFSRSAAIESSAILKPTAFGNESVRAYDPLINNSAPRPRFLRYKPNRRREIFLRLENKITEEGLLKGDEEFKEICYDRNDDDPEEETEEADEGGTVLNLKGVLKLFLVSIALIVSTLYITSMNSARPSPAFETFRSLKSKYQKFHNQIFQSGFLGEVEENQLGLLEFSNRTFNNRFELEDMTNVYNQLHSAFQIRKPLLRAFSSLRNKLEKFNSHMSRTLFLGEIDENQLGLLEMTNKTFDWFEQEWTVLVEHNVGSDEPVALKDGQSKKVLKQFARSDSFQYFQLQNSTVNYSEIEVSMEIEKIIESKKVDLITNDEDQVEDEQTQMGFLAMSSKSYDYGFDSEFSQLGEAEVELQDEDSEYIIRSDSFQYFQLQNSTVNYSEIEVSMEIEKIIESKKVDLITNDEDQVEDEQTQMGFLAMSSKSYDYGFDSEFSQLGEAEVELQDEDSEYNISHFAKYDVFQDFHFPNCTVGYSAQEVDFAMEKIVELTNVNSVIESDGKVEDNKVLIEPVEKTEKIAVMGIGKERKTGMGLILEVIDIVNTNFDVTSPSKLFIVMAMIASLVLGLCFKLRKSSPNKSLTTREFYSDLKHKQEKISSIILKNEGLSRKVESLTTHSSTLFHSPLDEIPEVDKRSVAPIVQLLGEFVFAEVTNSSFKKCSTKRKKMVIESKERRNQFVHSEEKPHSVQGSKAKRSNSEFRANGSTLFGSFIAQEKILKKEEDKDMKVFITPVRRSSRIRNRATVTPPSSKGRDQF